MRVQTAKNGEKEGGGEQAGEVNEGKEGKEGKEKATMGRLGELADVEADAEVHDEDALVVRRAAGVGASL